MSTTALLSLAFLLSTLLSSAVPEPVLDIDGKPVLPGTSYYILPVLRGMGGGLTPAPLNNTICPLYVSQEILEVRDGLPIKLYPFNSSATSVHLSTDTNFVFSGVTICIESMVWEADNVDGIRYVGINGAMGNPGNETIASWFTVEKSGEFYKLVFCPTVCDICKPQCGEIGVVMNGGRRFLAIDHQRSPLQVKFKKADELLQDH